MWSYVDDGVCLDVVHVWVAETQLLAPPLGGADDTRGDGVLQGERAADGDHELAGPQVGRASQQQHGQLNLHTQGGAGQNREYWRWACGECHVPVGRFCGWFCSWKAEIKESISLDTKQLISCATLILRSSSDSVHSLRVLTWRWPKRVTNATSLGTHGSLSTQYSAFLKDEIKNRQLSKDTGLCVSEHLFSQITFQSTSMSAHSHSSL